MLMFVLWPMNFLKIRYMGMCNDSPACFSFSGLFYQLHHTFLK